jgi:hypothetical protein
MILKTILQCLRQIRGLDLFTPCQIRDYPRQIEDSVISSRQQIELTHCCPHQTLTLRQTQYSAFILQFAKLPDLPDAHIGGTLCVRKADINIQVKLIMLNCVITGLAWQSLLNVFRVVPMPCTVRFAYWRTVSIADNYTNINIHLIWPT